MGLSGCRAKGGFGPMAHVLVSCGGGALLLKPQGMRFGLGIWVLGFRPEV